MKPLLKPLFSALTAVLALSSTGALATALRAPAPQATVKSSPKGLEVVATAPAGHHFNIKAPNSLHIEDEKNRAKPISADEKQIRFELPSSTRRALLLTLYLCDDANSFCEKHVVRVEGTNQTTKKTGHLETAPQPPTAGELHRDEFGFILNNAEAALKQAKESDKPLLIDFFGIWCPPCNELDYQVFSSSEFQRQSAGFIKLKLDADSEASWTLKSKYKVGGYPTVVFAAPNGEEIFRVVGFRPKDQFLELLKKAAADKKQGFSELKEKADGGDTLAAGKLGLIFLERKEYALARQYLAKSADHLEKLADAEIGYWEKNETENEKEAGAKLIGALESALTRFPESPDSVDRGMRLAERYDNLNQSVKRKAVLERAEALALTLVTRPEKLKQRDLSTADLWAMIAEIRASLSNDAGAKEAWAKAAADYRRNITSETQRGYHLELAYCLWKAGDAGAAEEIYRRFESKYPKEFTFFYGHASMNLQRKQLTEAQRLANLALQNSYGDNKLRAVHLMARTLKELGQRKEALELVRSTLRSARLPQDHGVRTHRYVKNLRDLESSLQ